MTNFDRWKHENITLNKLIPKWASECEICPLKNLSEYCQDYHSDEDCKTKLKCWADQEATKCV